MHSPEFGFEKERANVERAVHDLNVGYPVALDSNQAIWRAFKNEYWPADYFIDRAGVIRRHHFGEGDYDEAERFIQGLLGSNGGAGADRTLVSARGEGIEAAPELGRVQSPETYVGFSRAERFASTQQVAPSTERTYTVPRNLQLNQWGLSGAWIINGEYATMRGGSGTIAYRFHSRDLHMVLAPAANNSSIRFTVKLDGAPPEGDAGIDTSADGNGIVRTSRLYQLIRQQGRVADRTFEIEFHDPGIRAFVFTFG